MNREKTAQAPIVLVLLLFFFSGALALVYQVVWARMMTHVFGSTAVAVGTVLAAFMAGMAIGSWTIGRLADRSENRLRLYAWLEIGIAVAALVSHLALDRLDAVYPVLHGLVGGAGTLLALIRFLAAFLLVVIPTVLMGATLPVLSRFLVTGRGRVGAQLGTLYAVNTLGAVAGVLLTGFLPDRPLRYPCAGLWRGDRQSDDRRYRLAGFTTRGHSRAGDRAACADAGGRNRA